MCISDRVYGADEPTSEEEFFRHREEPRLCAARARGLRGSATHILRHGSADVLSSGECVVEVAQATLQSHRLCLLGLGEQAVGYEVVAADRIAGDTMHRFYSCLILVAVVVIFLVDSSDDVRANAMVLCLLAVASGGGGGSSSSSSGGRSSRSNDSSGDGSRSTAIFAAFSVSDSDGYWFT